jgi:hypothetical protein
MTPMKHAADLYRSAESCERTDPYVSNLLRLIAGRMYDLDDKYQADCADFARRQVSRFGSDPGVAARTIAILTKIGL